MLAALFSSIWLGVVLLSLLFVYSSVGSAIPPVRQLRIFEMTEFEWFHYWPFNLLIALICLNLVVATLRRIPFKPINFGVWMIHSGIIILALGSVWYFGTKVEGDAIVGRRMVTLSLPGVDPVQMAAQPGQSIEFGSDDVQYAVQVSNIDPSWELLSGPDKGVRAYSVTLGIERRDATGEHFFMRQLIAGFPQYTEDILRTNDHAQPMQRARRVNPDGDPLVDKSLEASLTYQPQDHFYLVNSAALYVREVDADGTPRTAWVQRPIDRLPRYNDYITDYDALWLPPSDPPPPLEDLRIEVKPSDPSGDPLPDTAIVVTDYLRYAVMDERRMPGGDAFDPVVTLELSAPDGRRALYELVADDPEKRSAENGELLFTRVDTDEQLQSIAQAPGPQLTISVPGSAYEQTVGIESTLRRDPSTPFVDIGQTGYRYRVERTENNLHIADHDTISVAMVQVQTPDGSQFLRMVCDDPARTADFPLSESTTGHEQPLPMHESIAMTYEPGQRTAAVTVIAGPQRDQLHVMLAIDPARTVFQPIAPGESVDLGGATLTVQRYASATRVEHRPAVIAESRRNKDIGSQLSMVRVEVPTAQGYETAWLPFHLFPFEDAAHAMRRFRYQPARVVLDDRGTPDASDDRILEIMYSRQRAPLPAPVVLDDFVITSHTGGFDQSGGTASIRNWTSVVRFADQSQRHVAWHEPVEVSVNEPIEFDGYWFFQSQWDAPDPPRGAGDMGSRGMNYTVLGVGNRNGVNVMLAGCCISVIGMLYAFYFKPVLRRRRMLQVHAALAEQPGSGALNGAARALPVDESPQLDEAGVPAGERAS